MIFFLELFKMLVGHTYSPKKLSLLVMDAGKDPLRLV